jgi:CRISPR-associated protein Cas2
MLDAMQLKMVESQLIKLINPQVDSVRIYELGNAYQRKVRHYGAKPSFDVTEPLII